MLAIFFLPFLFFAIFIYSQHCVCVCLYDDDDDDDLSFFIHSLIPYIFTVHVSGIYSDLPGYKVYKKKNHNFTNGTPKWMKERSRRKKNLYYTNIENLCKWLYDDHRTTAFFFAYNILSFCLIATRIIFKKILYDQIIFLCSILVAWLLLLLLVVGCYGEIKEIEKKSNI